MLHITPDDIAALSDEDLRTLVGLLAESELRRPDLPTSAVTWGGNQTAADGGIDVRVSLSADTSISGFVPRPATGFQVKREDMPRGEILDEMKPQGVLRPIIKELAAAKGAYIIVSSQGSTSDAALRHRKEAMSEAIAELPNAADLHLDFYDRTRLATWVREHNGLIPWVRTRIGRPMQGWQSYGGWAFALAGTGDKYLVDDRLRVKTGKKDDSAGLAATAGLERIRVTLSSPRGVARLVGLSGVGKTRFAQALFDEEVGEHSLDTSLAIYTNINDGPQPDPVGLATGLIASRSRAILVVDNCAPELHRRLSEVCRTEGSTVSLLTIEYDIREDEPEGTEVFSLEASSPELIVKLLKHRYPDLSGVDAQTIAEFSGGNARIAIALADTVGKNETLAGLKEEELFARLLRQRHEHDEALLRAAQAVALVYSFDGETVEGPDCELARLGQLVGLKAEEVFAKVAELKRRDLVQKRSHWRAVLPHAIANRLAELALQNIPRPQIEKQIGSGAPERLRKSLSRRLGWLEKSEEGKAIIESWLSPDGLLGNVASLNETGEAMLRNIAPVEPERVLMAIEHAVAGASGDAITRIGRKYSRLVRSIAFDRVLFERATNILAAMTNAAAGQERGGALQLFTSLFYLYLSGTHATIHQRLKVIESLFNSEDETDRDLAVHALKAVLEATHFSSTYSFEFGARSRDYGYWPKTREDIAEWYGAGLRHLETLHATGRDTERLEAVLAEKFKGLWVRVGVYDDLERMATSIASKGFWREGWIEVLRTKRQTDDKLPPEVAERISKLETNLRPANLVQKVRVVVLSRKLRGVSEKDFTDFDDEGDGITIYERAERLAVKLGQQLAVDAKAFDELMPELVSGKGRLGSLGKGLARQENAGALWSRLVDQLAVTPPGQRNVAVLLGMLAGFRERSSTVVNSYLDEASTDEMLAEWFPLLQTAVPIDAAGVARLKRSLELGKAPLDMYRNLMFGRATEPISGPDLAELLRTIAARPGGVDVAVDILSMRFHGDNDLKRERHPELLRVGRELLSLTVFDHKNDRRDYELGSIARASLKGVEGVAATREICTRLREAIATYQTSTHNHDDLLKSLFKVQPKAALDGLLSGNPEEVSRGLRAFDDLDRDRDVPMKSFPGDVLQEWCAEEPSTRYMVAARIVNLLARPDEKGPLTFTPIALQILNTAPNKIAVLEVFTSRFRPMSWSGSRAEIIEANVKALDTLESSTDPTVNAFLQAERTRLARDVEKERKWEASTSRDRDERFE